MASLIILFIPLVVLMFFSLYEFKYIFSPAFSITIGFALQIFFCFFYVDEWNINLSVVTIGVVLLGCSCFVITSWILASARIKVVIGNKGRYTKNSRYSYDAPTPFVVETWKLVLFFVVQTLTLLGYVIFMNSHMQGANIAAKVYYYRSMTADYGKRIEIPLFLSFFRLLSSATGYCLLYIFAYNFANKFKVHRIWNSILTLANLLLSLLIEGILGARGGMFNFIVAFFALYLFLSYKYGRLSVSFRLLFKYFMYGVAIILMLPVLGNALGRPMTNGALYDIAFYIGGPLVNLDTFIKTQNVSKIRHFSTMYNIFLDFQDYFGDEFVAAQKLPIRWNFINGNTTGNVYTAFANYWYDNSWVGVIFWSCMAAIIMHFICKKLMLTSYDDNQVSISGVLFAYFLPCIMFSFFTNRFFVQIFSLYLIKFIIAVVVVAIFIERVSFVRPKFIRT